MRHVRVTLLAAVGVVFAVIAGCKAHHPHYVSEADRVMDRIDTGHHRPGVPPTTLINTRKKLYVVGEDIRVTVRVIAPVDDEALDPYLPVTGRFRVKRDGAAFALRAPRSSARLAWIQIPVEHNRKRERSFTVTVNSVYPMNNLGWYAIWWEGVDDLGYRMHSGETYVRVMARVPK
ncbi:MAG: hypothetical protein ACYTGB_04135 [Planctomycetota bacterium]|jgi:hypothetical protein